ncbi:MAG: hypothetical protein ACLSG5_02025 [Oscillospiraceae bacterium]
MGLSDGEYTVDVTLSGGSGRASVQSRRSSRFPAAASAEIVWSSSNYDYMRIGEENSFR